MPDAHYGKEVCQFNYYAYLLSVNYYSLHT